ncbi:hypothetical protein F6793_20080 [Salmonella enterica]|nr:hypothetical protein [Salmonella enterica]ECY2339821.1 hypothetical protein [Salmonella enterica]ECY2374121.1 hypothetical protein [Salmonella enterica]
MALKGAFLMQIIYYCDNTARDKNIKYIHIVNMFYWNGCFRYDKSLKKPIDVKRNKNCLYSDSV